MLENILVIQEFACQNDVLNYAVSVIMVFTWKVFLAM